MKTGTRMSAAFAYVVLLFSLASSSDAQMVVEKESKTPGAILENLWILPSGWITRIPPQGMVNAPGQLEAITPGQKFAIALMAEGTDRDTLLAGRTLDIHLVSSAGTAEIHNLQPVAIRRIKASGADFVMTILDAAGIGKDNEAQITEVASMVTLAIFEPEWSAPPVDAQENIQISVTVSGGQTPAPSIKPVSLKLRPWKDWQADSAPDEIEVEEMMNGFHNTPQPGRLLPMLRSAARAGGLKEPPVYSFFAVAFRENEDARKAVLEVFPSLEPLDKWAFLLALRFGGQDVSQLMSNLSTEIKESLASIQPLKGPEQLQSLFQETVTVETVMSIGARMDECWGGWIATGNPDYLRALVGLLEAAADFPVFQKWLEAKQGAKGLNAQVARGMAYKIAGWSLSAFQRTDPQVADWLLFWENDPNMPSTIRAQIASLFNNPIFRDTNSSSSETESR